MSYKKLIEIKFIREIPWNSDVTSVTLSLLIIQKIPAEVNQFRTGEALFFVNDLFTGKSFKGMETYVFKLFSQIIELHHKPIVPSGDQIENVAGHIPDFNKEDLGKFTFRAITDVGLLDINPSFLKPEDENI